MSSQSSSSPATKIASIALAGSALSTQIVSVAHADDTGQATPSSDNIKCVSVPAGGSAGNEAAEAAEAARQSLARTEEELGAKSAELDSAETRLAENRAAVELSEAAVQQASTEQQNAFGELNTRVTKQQQSAADAVETARQQLSTEQASHTAALSELAAANQQAELTEQQNNAIRQQLEQQREATAAAITPADLEPGPDSTPRLETINQRITSLNDEIAQLQRTVTDAAASRQQLEEQQATLREQAEAAATALNSAQTAFTDAEARQQQTAAELTAAEQALNAATSELARVEVQVGDGSALEQQLTDKLTAATAERDRAAASVTSLNQQLGELNTELERLIAELQSAQTEADSKAAELNAAEQNSAFRPEELISREVLTENLALFRDSAQGPERIAELSDAPADLTGYFLRATLPDGREITLPVTAITAEGGATANPAAEGGATDGSQSESFTVHVTVPGNIAHLPSVTLTLPRLNPQTASVYRTFASLIEAIKADPTGTFRLGANLQVETNDTAAGSAYLTSPFTGTLDGQGFSISRLTKPLFSELSAGARVQNLALTDVNITSNEANTAALAQQATGTNTHVTNVRVKGRIEGDKSAAGIISEAQNTRFEEVFFEGRLYSNWRREGANLGGLVGKLAGGSITDSGSQATLETAYRQQNNTVGGLVGHLTDGAAITRSYVGGSITNGRTRGNAGGIVGSVKQTTGQPGTVSNVVSAVAVHGGRIGHGDTSVNAQMTEIRYLAGEASGTADAHAAGTQVEADAAEAAYNALQLNYRVRPGGKTATGSDRFAGVAEARADRQQAYKNYALLTPLATAAAIVRAGNLLADSDPLVTKVLRSALPIVNGRVNFAPLGADQHVDGVFLHFADSSVQRRAVKPAAATGSQGGSSTVGGQGGSAATQTDVAGAATAYRFTDGLPYTPAQLKTPDKRFIDELARELGAVQFDSINIAALVTPQKWQETLQKQKTGSDEEKQRAAAAELRGLLYLDTVFAQQREQLAEVLQKLVSQERTSATAPGSQAALQRKILENKEAFLLALAYVNKWYNIDFGEANLRDLLVFRQDFYGSKQSPVDWLIAFGKDYYHLDPQKNTEAYAKYASQYARHVDILDLLESTRKQFTTTNSFDEWFRQTTKAHLVETPSKEVPDHDVTASERFRQTRYKTFMLPLLTVSENTVFVMVHMTSITMGSFERYYDARRATTPELVKQRVAEIKESLGSYAEKYRDYYDMWYRISKDSVKPKLLASIPVLDGYGSEAGWSAQYGPGAMRSVAEFFGPTGNWYPNAPYGAYSNGDATFMVQASSLSPYGIALYTHEMVHNLDYRVFLSGYDRRAGALPEMYPVSLLQNPTNRSSEALGFNQSAYFENEQGLYLHNHRPDRFQTVTDLNQYFKGYFNALYLLDNAEAEAMLAQTPEALSAMLMRLGNHVQGGATVNSYDALTAEQIRQMGLGSINDLIENSLMIRRANQPSNGPLIRNGYPNVTVLDPLYGTGESTTGITGESAFRRNALELLAAKGYEDGFISYTSNRLADAARAAGRGDMPDSVLMPIIFAGDPYSTLKDYRKHAYAEVRARAATHLQPLTVNFDGRAETFTNYQQLVDRFKELLADDVTKNRQGNRNSKAYAFKGALFSALMRQTDEFKTSLFTDGKDQLVPWAVAPKPAATPPQQLPQRAIPELEIAGQQQQATELAAIRQRLAAAEAAVGRIRETREQHQLTAAAKQAELQTLNSRVAALSNELVEGSARLAELRQRAEAQRNTVEQLRERAAERAAAKEAAEQRIRTAATAVTASEQQLTRARELLTESVTALNALVDRASQAATQREALLPEAARLTALRDLLQAFDAVQALSDSAEDNAGAARERVDRAQKAVSTAASRVAQLAATVSQLETEQQQLQELAAAAPFTAENLAQLGGSALAAVPAIAEALAEVHRRITALGDAVTARDKAQEQLRVSEEAVASLAAAKSRAQSAVLQATLELQRLETAAAATPHPQNLSCVPRTAPTASDLPVYDLSQLPLTAVPRNFPTVDPLPAYDLAAVDPVTPAPKPASSQPAGSAPQPAGSALAKTGGSERSAAELSALALALSGLGAALGITAKRGQRKP